MLIQIYNSFCILNKGGTDFLRETDIIEDLREEFSVMAQNYYFSQLYKTGKWDGKKHFITPKGRMMIGLLPFVIESLKEQKVDYVFNDHRTKLINFHSLSTTFGNDTLRDYQIDARKSAEYYIDDLPFYRGIFDCATNAGKNHIIGTLIKDSTAKKIIILIHRDLIYKQAIEFFSQFFEVGTTKNLEPRVLIFMQQEFYNKTQKSKNHQKLLSDIDMVIVDESHSAKSPTMIKLLMLINCASVYFMSGTSIDFTEAEDKLTVVGLSGKKLIKITTQDLIDKKVSLKPIIKYYTVDSHYELEYEDSYRKNIMENDYRNSLIFNECINSNKYVLINVTRIDHANAIQKYFDIMGFHIDILSAQTDDGDQLFNDFKSGKKKWLISTIIKEGLNVKIIQKMINADPLKSKITLKQRFGRLVRVNEDINEQVEVIEFLDTCKYFKKNFNKRKKIYNEEGFELIKI